MCSKIGIRWEPYEKQPFTDVDIIEEASLHMRSLHLFPRARELDIFCELWLFKTASNNLLAAIWKTIPAALPNLKIFKFSPNVCELDLPPDIPPDPQERYTGIHSLLCPESRQLLGPAYISDEEFARSVFPSFRLVERVVLESSGYDLWTSGANISNFLVFISTRTLRHLSITAHHIEMPDVNDGFQPIISPNVVDLDIEIEFIGIVQYAPLLKYLATSFPNVQRLSLASSGDRIYIPPLDPMHMDQAYAELALMSKLRKATVPWPWNQETRFKRRELAGVIRRLIWSGLGQLEEIKFVRKTSIYLDCCRKCWVTRDEAMRIKLLWGEPYLDFDLDPDPDSDLDLDGYKGSTTGQKTEEDGGDSDDTLGDEP